MYMLHIYMYNNNKEKEAMNLWGVRVWKSLERWEGKGKWYNYILIQHKNKRCRANVEKSPGYIQVS